MRTPLQEVHDRYIPVEDEDGINPISLVDAQIVDKFFDVIEKLTNNKSLIEIVDRYKRIPDDQLYDMLSVFEESFAGGSENARQFVTLKGQRLTINEIRSIEPVDGYDSDISSPTYSILINRTENAYTPHANTAISYATGEERDEALRELESKLEDTGKVKFI